MKFPKDCKIHLVAEKSLSRYTINSVFLDKEGARPCLVATNGKALARVDVDDADDDIQGFIALAAIKAATTGKGLCAEISRNGETTAKGRNGETTTFRNPEGDQFPQHRQIVPKTTPEYRIALDPHMLANLAKAIGAEWVELRCHPGGRPIEVIPTDCVDSSRVGLLMPVSINPKG